MMIRKRRDRRPHAAAMTLIELLVVLAVFSILAAVALPTVRNTLREQRVSRAANAVQAYIEDARSRAIASGRPHGVILRRAGTDDAVNRSMALEMRMCAAPPSYFGDVAGSRCYLEKNTDRNDNEVFLLWFSRAQALAIQQSYNLRRTVDADASTRADQRAVVRVGDTVQIGSGIGADATLRVGELGIHGDANPTGDTYTSDAATVALGDNKPLYVVLNSQFFSSTTWDKLSKHVGRLHPFEFMRAPRPTSTDALELVDGAAIDLTFSGVGIGGWQFSPLDIEGNSDPQNSPVFAASARDYRDVWLVFGGDGVLERVYNGVRRDDAPGEPIDLPYIAPPSSVHLLLGRVDHVRPEAPLSIDLVTDEGSNLFRSDAVWLTILKASGEVTSSRATFLGTGDMVALDAWEDADEPSRRNELTDRVTRSRAEFLADDLGAQ